MNKGINLAGGKKQTGGRYKKIFYFSCAVFFVTVTVSIGLIIYRLILKVSFDGLESREQEINTQLLALQEKKDKLLETKNRIVNIKEILASRAPTTSRLDTVGLLVPQDSVVNSVNGDEAEIQVTLETENLNQLDQLIEQKIAEIANDTKRNITKVEIQSFSLNPKTLLYEISLGVTFA